MVEQLLACDLGGDVGQAALQKTKVLFDQGVLGEARCHGCVLDGLHLHGVGRAVSLELGNNKPTTGVDAQDVEPVAFAVSTRRPPPVELERHDPNVRPEDLGVGQHPLLQFSALA